LGARLTGHASRIGPRPPALDTRCALRLTLLVLGERDYRSIGRPAAVRSQRH
jgi:hypothetical protein